MANTRQIIFNDKLKGPKFLSPLIRTVNQMARVLNGMSVLSGGDVILTNNGLLLRIKNSSDSHLWKIFKAGGLDISMIDGKYRSISSTSLLPFQSTATTADLTMADNSTVKVWVEFNIAGTEAAGMTVYEVTGYTIDHGASVPTDTFEIDTDTDGDLYIEIAEIVTAEGSVESISQTLTEEVTMTFPLIPVNILPSGAAGDILFHDGTAWVVLAKGTENAYLKSTGDAPAWQNPDAC